MVKTFEVQYQDGTSEHIDADYYNSDLVGVNHMWVEFYTGSDKTATVQAIAVKSIHVKRES